MSHIGHDHGESSSKIACSPIALTPQSPTANSAIGRA